MSSSSQPERGGFCAAKPLSGGCRFQSSRPHLKRFIMFDHSNGKGRVIFHPAVAQEVFGSGQPLGWESKEFHPGKEAKGEYSTSGLPAYRQIIEGAFISLQSVTASRHSEALVQKRDPSLPGKLVSPQRPRVSESIANIEGKKLMLGVRLAAQQHVASKALVCEEKPKVLAVLPSTETDLYFNQRGIGGGSSNTNINCNSGLDRSEATTSELMHENSEDLDALLSSDEDDDEDVQSTGHSPDESAGKEESYGGGDDADEVEQHPCKKRRISLNHGVEVQKDLVFPGEGSINQSRKQKIKRTVRALRCMIPGGALLDSAFVLDKTIAYLKTLRDRVNQLEVSRLQSHF